jgi:hypothetical protein
MISALNGCNLAAIFRWLAENGELIPNLSKSQEIPFSNSAVGIVPMIVLPLIVNLRRCVRGFMPHCIDCVC